MNRTFTIALAGSLFLVFGCGGAPPPTSGSPGSGSATGSSPPPPGGGQEVKSGSDDTAKADATGENKEEIRSRRINADAAEGAAGKDKGAAGDGPGAPQQASTTSSTPLGGRLTQKEIGDILSKNAALFNDCYTIGAGKSQQFTGTVTVKATLGPSGSVTDAQVIKSTAKNAKVDECVVSAFKKIKFPAPKDGATSVITFPMEFQGAEQVR